MDGDRWLAVGKSDDRDSQTAGTAAAADALDRDGAKLLIVFCSHAHDLPKLVTGIRQRAGREVPLVGCTTGGEIATTGPGDAGVVVTALGGEGFTVATGFSVGVSQRLRAAGAEAADCVGKIANSPHRVLLMLTDGLAGDQTEIVRGAYSVAGAGVPLVGGCAGDDLKMQTTHQLHGEQVLTDAVVAAALGSDSPIGIGVRHGWQTVGEPMLVTESADNRVYKLDDRPALEVYMERLSPPEEVAADGAAFTRFAQTHPLGIASRSGEPRARFVGEANFKDGSLGCIAAVPQGRLAWLMEGDDSSVLEATDSACIDALSALGEQPPLGMLAFDCVARRGVLGDEGIRAEIERVAELGDGAPVAGFYTYGEIARTQGVNGFHNQTLVVMAVS